MHKHTHTHTHPHTRTDTHTDSHAIDLGGNLQPVDVHMQLHIVLLHKLVLDTVDFGHYGNRGAGVLRPGKRDGGQHLFLPL